jgi:hypothetical protein
MPGSKRTFEYLIAAGPDDTEKVLRKAERILAWACDGDERIECHGISGGAVGAVTLNLTIVNRDQWACRQLAQDILNLVVWGLDKDATQLALQSRRQEVHGHRGYSHGRTKRYREPRTPPHPAPGPRPPR